MRLANQRLIYWLEEGWSDQAAILAARGYYQWLIEPKGWNQESCERSLHELLCYRGDA